MVLFMYAVQIYGCFYLEKVSVDLKRKLYTMINFIFMTSCYFIFTSELKFHVGYGLSQRFTNQILLKVDHYFCFFTLIPVLD